MNTSEAQGLADNLTEYLSPTCSRFELAGSLRRGYRKVHDLDFVAIPIREERHAEDLFGEYGPPEKIDLLEEAVTEIEDRLGDWRKAARGSGEKRKKIEHIPTGLTAEVFVANPWNFGVVLAVRTGPSDTAAQYMKITLFRNRQVSGGFYLHDHPAEQRDGDIRACVYKSSCPHILKIEEELAFFDAIGLEYTPPEKRARDIITRSAQQVWDLDRLGPKRRNTERKKFP